MISRLVELPYPFPHQQEILLDDHRFKVCDLGRQAGKTLMGGIMCLDGHGPLIVQRDPLGNVVYVGPKFCGALHGGTIWWVSRDFPTATRIWRDLKGYLKRWGGELEKSEQEKSIHWPGGGSLTIKSASDPDSLRGATLDGLVGDEVAFWNPDALNLSLRPALAVKQGWFVLISTPNGLNFFHDEYRRGADRTDPDYMSWKMPSSVNPALTHDELMRMRSSLGLYGYQRECMAEFEVREGGMFKGDWFTFFQIDGNPQDPHNCYLIPDKGERVCLEACSVFMTADFALTAKNYSDFTATGVFAKAQDGRVFVLDFTRGKLEVPDVIRLICHQMDRWLASIIYLEASGPLVHMNAEAERAMPGRIRLYKTHQEKKDKVERAQPAAAATERGRLLVLKQKDGRYAPWVGPLITECCAFPDKHVHDDQVDALALGVLCAPPTPVIRPQRQAPRVFNPETEQEDRVPGWQIGRD